MPFRALRDGVVVPPASVSKGEPVVCPICEGTMYARGGDQQARHFYHQSAEAEDACSRRRSGESETHAEAVAIAVATLQEEFGSQAADVGAEVQLDVSDTRTLPDVRRADALLEFDENNPYFGRGIIIEVQHRHHSKDVEATTHDYLAADYSVAWIQAHEFDDTSLDVGLLNDRFENPDQDGYSVRDHSAREFEVRPSARLEWEQPRVSCRYADQFDGHAWEEFPAYAHPKGYEYQVCRGCGLRKQYDDELTRYVYDYDGVLAPETPISVLEDAIVPYVDLKRKFPMPFEEWVETRAPTRGPTAFEYAVTSNHSVEPCRGSHRIHEWEEPKTLEEDYNDVPTVQLRGCKHCPVHLLTQFWKGGQSELSLIFGTRPPDWWNFGGLRANPYKCTSRYHDRQFDFCPDCGLAFGQLASEE